MGAKTSSEKAYADAYTALVELLEGVGHEHPHEAARDWMRGLVTAGWRHVRPTVDQEPPAGPAASPDVAAAALAEARAVLARREIR